MNIIPIDTNTAAFADAYRSCAYDLSAACGQSKPKSDPIDCTWYLDPRIEALGCICNGCITAFILYTKQPYFIEGSDDEILDVWVGRKSRRMGLGQALVDAVMAQVAGSIGIQIHQLNSGAVEFWRDVCASAHRSIVPCAASEEDELIFLLVPNDTKPDATDQSDDAMVG